MSNTTYKYGSNGNFGRRQGKFEEGLVKNEGLNLHEQMSLSHMDKFVRANPTVSISCQYTQLFSTIDKYNSKILLGMTEAVGRSKEVNGDRVHFTISGSPEKFVHIVKVVCTDSRPGIYGQPFDIVVNRPYLSPSMVIMAENNIYSLRVIPDQNGSRAHRAEGSIGYRYTVQLVDTEDGRYLDPKYIAVGKRWVPYTTYVSTESNMDAAGMNFNTVFDSFGTMGQSARHYYLTDASCRRIKQWHSGGKQGEMPKETAFGEPMDMNKLTSALWIEVDRVGGGKEIKYEAKWMNAFDSTMHNLVHNDIELAMTYGRGSYKKMRSYEGFAISTSASIREYLDSAPMLQHYGVLNLQQIATWIRSIIQHKVETGKARIYLDAGTQFAIAFDMAIKRELSQFQMLDTHFIKGKDNAELEFGATFTKYKILDMEIMVRVNDNLDNPLYCSQMLPFMPTMCTDSMRADILDFGAAGSDGEVAKGSDNMLFIYESHLNYHITSGGKWDPTTFMPIVDGSKGLIGSNNSGIGAHVEKSGGLIIKDVTRIGSIQFARSAA